MSEHGSIDLAPIIGASDRAYGLLVWLGDLVDAERISVGDARDVLASPDGAANFLRRHWASLPSDLSPPDGEAERLTANILGTYLAVSFDLQDHPGESRRPDPLCAPGCPWCWHVSKGPHLKAKTPTTSDKRRAKEAARRAVQDLVQAAAADIDDETLDALLAAHQEEAAVIAYTGALVDRAMRRTASSTSLALWRLFAWKDGSPRRNFQFDLPLVERSHASILRDASVGPS